MKKTTCILLLLCSLVPLWSQNRVYLEHSDVLAFDERRLPDAQILRGNVCFRHDEALMYCDSAYFYERTNSVTAFGHIRFEQGDTLHGYGDRLYYDGNIRLARLCRNVRLVHRTTTLTTDSLNYDRHLNLAYYFTGGKIQDSLNILTSVWGEYNTSSSQAFFRRQVHLQNESFTFDTDTLYYNTKTAIAQIVCPTTIVYDQETTILSSNGFYNTSSEQSTLYDRSLIIHNDGKSLTGDTIFYDKQRGFGQLFRHIEINDTAQHLSLYGNYGEVWEKDKSGFATDSAMVVDYSQDEPTYIHADSLFSNQINYYDSLLGDTNYIQVKAYHHVRAYSDNYQLVCDSLHYIGRDSLMTLCGMPILWSDSNQVVADTMTLYFVNGSLHHIYAIGKPFATRQVTTDYFDQLAGREMTAYVKDNELSEVKVSGNAQTVFYPKDDNGDIIGVNRTESSYVQIYIEDRKIHHVLFTTSTTGVLYPLDQLPRKDHYLGMFFWADKERPKNKEDIFKYPPRSERPKPTISSTDDD